MKNIYEFLTAVLSIIVMVLVFVAMKPQDTNMYLVDDRDHADDCFELYDDYDLLGYFCPTNGSLDVFHFVPVN